MEREPTSFGNMFLIFKIRSCRESPETLHLSVSLVILL
jgi:hypothetical protein